MTARARARATFASSRGPGTGRGGARPRGCVRRAARYTGSGKKQAEGAPVEQTACKKEACAIQWCLARRNHQEKYCLDYIAAWKECCERARAAEAARLADAAAAAAAR